MKHVKCLKCGLTFAKEEEGNIRPHKAKCGRWCAGGSYLYKEVPYTLSSGRQLLEGCPIWPGDLPGNHPDNKSCDHKNCIRRRNKNP